MLDEIGVEGQIKIKQAKVLVVGVHGPREVYVLLIDEPGDIMTP